MRGGRLCRVTGNTSGEPASYGIFAGSRSTVRSCSVTGTATTASPSTSIQGVGIGATERVWIEGCTVMNCHGDGILVENNCHVTGNTLADNGGGSDASHNGAGVHATGFRNVIDGNSVLNNKKGVHVSNIKNHIIRNLANSNTVNYQIIALNRVGTVVSAPYTSVDVSGNSGGNGVGTTDPWANFVY